MVVTVWQWIFIVAVAIVVPIGGGLAMQRFAVNVDNFLVAGRKVRAFLLCSAGSATEMGVVAVTMLAMEGYVRGPVALSYSILGLVTYLFVGATGFVIYRLRETKAVTLGHFIEMRYGSKRLRTFAGLPLVVTGISTIALSPAVAGVFFTYFLGFPPQTHILGMVVNTPLLISGILLALIVAYTTASGALGVIVSDYMELLIIWTAVITVAVCVARNTTWGAILDVFSATRGDLAFSTLKEPSYGMGWIVMSFLLYFGGIVVWPTAATRVLASADPKVAKRMFVLSSLLHPGRMCILVLSGMAAATLIKASDLPDASLVTFGAPAMAAMPMYLPRILPPLGLTIFIAALFAAHISMCNAYYLSWSGMITQDIIVPVSGRKLTIPQQLRINRFVIVALGICVFLWCVFFKLNETLLLFVQLSACAYTPAAFTLLAFGLYWKRANRHGAWCGMVLGPILPILSIILTGFLGVKFLEIKWVGILAFALSATGMAAGSLVGERFVGKDAERSVVMDDELVAGGQKTD